MLKKRPKERISERKDPGEEEPEYCSPGSIEQELDMCEEGSLRGDEILYSHGVDEEATPEVPRLDQIINRYEVDLAEENREGDEMSGDEHSSGLQGGESELTRQVHIDTGLPGNRTLREEQIELTEPWNEEENRAEPIPEKSLRPPERNTIKAKVKSKSKKKKRIS